MSRYVEPTYAEMTHELAKVGVNVIMLDFYETEELYYTFLATGKIKRKPLKPENKTENIKHNE